MYKDALVFDEALDIILFIDTNMNIIDANKAAVKAYEYTKEELLQMNVEALRADHFRHQLTSQFKEEALNNGIRFESTHKSKNGKIFPVEVSSKKVDLENKTIVVSIIRDISERKKFERELEIQQNYINYLFDKSPEGIVFLDNNSKILRINKGFEDLFNYSPEEVLGKNIRDILVPKDLHEEFKDFYDVIARGDIVELETMRIRKDGSVVEVFIRVFAFITNNTTEGIFVIYKDITEQKRSYEIIKKMYEAENIFSHISKHFLNVYDYSSAITLAMKKIGNFIFADRVGIYLYSEDNKSMKNISSWHNSKNSVSQDNLNTCSMGDYESKLMDILCNQGNLELSTDKLKELLEEQYNFFCDIGGIKSVLVLPLKYEDKIIGILKIDNITRETKWTKEDISFLNTCCEIIMLAYIRNKTEIELKKSNIDLYETLQQLKNTQFQLIQNEKLASIGYLAAGVAHEINNPLGFVSSNFETLKNYISTFKQLFDSFKEAEHYFQTSENEFIRKFAQDYNSITNTEDLSFIFEDMTDLFKDTSEGLRRISDIVKGLRNFSHQANHDDFEEYDLNFGIKNTLVISKNELKYSAEIIEEFGEIPLIEAIPGHINQVILNMLINAVHAIRSKGTSEMGVIKISTYTDLNYVYCRISDSGIGISYENINKIFTPFFTTKPVGLGTGLGLSISYDIVKNKHNGDVFVESEPDKGTVFTIKLPVVQLRQ